VIGAGGLPGRWLVHHRRCLRLDDVHSTDQTRIIAVRLTRRRPNRSCPRHVTLIHRPTPHVTLAYF
jgi:hypothetical protein